MPLEHEAMLNLDLLSRDKLTERDLHSSVHFEGRNGTQLQCEVTGYNL